ncbi:uncharacterized protein [Polyergus mexicanus]|uniref:uncharacterized protein n=1 Tax=Polyergus mexicanus TaxID=615972 RepID=UPI0038B531AD
MAHKDEIQHQIMKKINPAFIALSETRLTAEIEDNEVNQDIAFDTPMGSPLSPIIADLILQDLKRGAIESLPFDLPFYVRYVDDIALAAPSSMFRDVLRKFNSLHSRLQFTMKKGVGNKLDFFDVTIIINNGLMEFDWFHKPTFAGRSNKTLEDVMGISTKKQAFLFFNIPYVLSTSGKIRYAIRDLDTKISYTGINKLNRFIKVQKDDISKEFHRNVVYKISCKDCDTSYVGQTSRFLKTRIQEHRNHINQCWDLNATFGRIS